MYKLYIQISLIDNAGRSSLLPYRQKPEQHSVFTNTVTCLGYIYKIIVFATERLFLY